MSAGIACRLGAARSVGARVRGKTGGTLAITYSLEGDLARLRVPPRTISTRWRRTMKNPSVKRAR